MSGISNFFSNSLQSLDAFGKDYMFEEDKKSAFRTNFGGLLTFLITISVIIIGFIFGKEIYERKTPKVFSSDDITSIDNSLIKAVDLPFIITFHVVDG